MKLVYIFNYIQLSSKINSFKYVLFTLKTQLWWNIKLDSLRSPTPTQVQQMTSTLNYFSFCRPFECFELLYINTCKLTYKQSLKLLLFKGHNMPIRKTTHLDLFKVYTITKPNSNFYTKQEFDSNPTKTSYTHDLTSTISRILLPIFRVRVNIIF